MRSYPWNSRASWPGTAIFLSPPPGLIEKLLFSFIKTSYFLENASNEGFLWPASLCLRPSNKGVVGLWGETGKLLGGWIGTTENFVRIGHTLFALLAGWFGGQLSRRIWRASRPPGESMAGLS